MPSPPQKGESKESFIGRCISYLVKNEGKNQEQAAGQCYGMWRQAHGEGSARPKRDHIK